MNQHKLSGYKERASQRDVGAAGASIPLFFSGVAANSNAQNDGCPIPWGIGGKALTKAMISLILSQ